MRRAVANWVGLRFIDAAAPMAETAEVSAVHPAEFSILGLQSWCCSMRPSSSRRTMGGSM